jgi:hypothetical protein
MLLNLRSWRALRSRTGFLPGDCWCGMSRGRSVLFNLGFRSRLLCGPRTRLRAAWCGGLLLGHWLGDSHVGRMAAVGLGEGGFVSLSRGCVLRLGRGRSCVGLVFYRLLSGRGRVLNSARTAVVGDVIWVGHDACLHDALIYVSGVDIGLIHMHHSRVVGK